MNRVRANDPAPAARATARDDAPVPHVSPAGIALIVALAFVWGLNWPAIRVAVQEISPWTFRAICLAAAAVVLFGFSLARRARIVPLRREIGPLVIVALLNVTAYHLLTAFGLTMMTATRGILLTFTFPVWSVLIGRIVLRERLTRGRVAALLLGLAAVGILLGPEVVRLGSAPLGGVLLIGSAVSWALATMALKWFDWALGARELAAWQILIGGAPIVAGAFAFDSAPDFSALSTPAVIGLVYASVVGASIGQWIWFRMLQIMPAGIASISTLAIPVVGVFSGGLLLGEPVGWRELAALALVFAALAILLVGRRGLALARLVARRAGT